MKRILCTSIALIILLTVYSLLVRIAEPGAETSGDHTHGIYKFTFDAERVSGWPFEGWDFVYTYNGEQIKSGHQILFPLDIFTFHSIQVDVIERDAPENSYSVTFPVAICNGGSGKTEITVTDSAGRTATFKITCQVTQIGWR